MKLTKKEAIKRLNELLLSTSLLSDTDHEAMRMGLKALEWQYKSLQGNCHYCKYKNCPSLEYPCFACDDPRREMWEEAEE